MFTLLAAAALAASMGTHSSHTTLCGCHYSFAPNIDNGQLATLPPEDVTRVYTPGASDYSGRLWVGDAVRDIQSRRATRENPGRVVYGAANTGHEQVQLKVGSLVVTISPWQVIEGEGWANFERGRQQWLAERGYTGGVRTFVHPSRLPALQAHETGEAHANETECESGEPRPSATIRLRKPNATGGRIKQVDAGVAGGLQIVSGEAPMRMSLPMSVSAEVVERTIARGWSESDTTETKVANAQD